MKAILVFEVDNIDIENTQATYIELQCNNLTIQMALLNHWLKPIPQKKEIEKCDTWREMLRVESFNEIIDEMLGGTEDE